MYSEFALRVFPYSTPDISIHLSEESPIDSWDDGASQIGTPS